MAETLNIYKNDADGWTAQIITDESGVLDVQIFFNPKSEYARLIARGGRRYKQKLRIELPEDRRTPGTQEIGAWL